MSDYEPGSKAVIRHNPHAGHAVGIIGTVVEFRRGEGFGGCDLAYVEYIDPWTGEVETLPFGTGNLSPGTPAALLKMAERHEALATDLRRLAEEASR